MTFFKRSLLDFLHLEVFNPSVICNTVSNLLAIAASFSCILTKMIDKKRQLQSAQKRFNDISYIHYTSNLMQLSQILLKRVSTEYFCDTV